MRVVPALLALTVMVTPLALRAESEAAKKLSKNQEKYDADKDGKLSDEEKAAAKAGAKARAKETREANLKKYDANGDGKLDPEEKARQKTEEQTAHDAAKAEREARKAAREAEKK